MKNFFPLLCTKLTSKSVKSSYLLAVSLCFILPMTAGAVIITVTNTNNSGAGSLRQAIEDANLLTGPDNIEFNIGGGGAQSITVLTALPVITEGVHINGASQPGWSGTPLISIGENFAGQVLTITGSFVTLSSLNLSKTGANGGTGVDADSDGFSMTGCFVKNRITGIYVHDCANVTIDNNNFENSGTGSGFAIDLKNLTGLLPVTGNTFGGTFDRGVRIINLNSIAIKQSGGQINLPAGNGLELCANNPLWLESSSDILVDGLNLTRPGAAGGTGISVLNATNITIQNCTVKNWFYGIDLQIGSGASILNNDLTNSGVGGGNALHINSVGGSLLASGQTFGGATTNGVYLSGTNRIISDGSVAGTNIVIPNGSGLRSMSGTSINLVGGSGNRVEKVDLANPGASRTGTAISVNNSPNFTATRNQIINRTTGISDDSGGNCTITCNNIENCGIGVRLLGSAAATRHVKNNAIHANTTGVKNDTAPSQPVDATNNWWGSGAGPGAGGNNGTSGPNITTSPFSVPIPGCATVTSCTDADNDGYCAGQDCDDGNSAIHPGAQEICNGIDDDCDILVDGADPNLVDNTPPTITCPQNQTIPFTNTWQPVGTPGFSAGQADFTSLAFSGTTPYLAYQDYDIGQKASVKMFDGVNWVNVGIPGFSVGKAEYISLTFSGTTPYVAYQDYGIGQKATVKMFDGANWVNVGTSGFSAGSAPNTSIAFSGLTPYVAFTDNANGTKATVMKFDGTDWVIVGTPGFTASFAYYTTLAFSGTTPYLAYQDVANGAKASVMKFDGTNWVSVGLPGFSAGTAHFTSLAFSGSTPYLAYQDIANGSKATVMEFDGANWVNVGTPGFSAGTASFISLAFSGSTAYLAYQDIANGSKATVMKFDGTNWVNVGTPGFSAGQAIYNSLAFSGSTPYLAFGDNGSGGKATVMKLSSTCDALLGNWTYSAIVTDNCTAPENINVSQAPIATTLLSGHNDMETVTLTADDGNGNTASCWFTVTLTDLSPPTIACPGNLIRNGSSIQCNYLTLGAEFDPLAFVDNCPGSTIAWSLSGATTGNGSTPLAGTTFQSGNTTVQ